MQSNYHKLGSLSNIKNNGNLLLLSKPLLCRKSTDPMVLCQRKLGPVKKVEVEDEISMKKRIRESGRKLLAYHKLGRAEIYTVIVSALLTDFWPHAFIRIQPPAEKHVLCTYIKPPAKKQWGCPTYDNAQLMIITLLQWFTSMLQNYNQFYQHMRRTHVLSLLQISLCRCYRNFRLLQ